MGDAAVLPINPAEYLTDWLLEIGPLSSDGGALAWRDLTAWQEITGIVLEPWEARLIRRLSGDFGATRHQAEKPDCPPPYTGRDDDVLSKRDRVAKQVAAMFGP